MLVYGSLADCVHGTQARLSLFSALLNLIGALMFNAVLSNLSLPLRTGTSGRIGDSQEAYHAMEQVQ